MRGIGRLFLSGAFCCLIWSSGVLAQISDNLPAVRSQPAGSVAQKPTQQLGDAKLRAHRGTIGIISGSIDGTYARFASDLSAVVEEPDGPRILPILGKGSVQNLFDLLYLPGVDIGIVQSDVLAYIKHENLYPGIDTHVKYISKLYDEELHILAGKGITSVKDLVGKKVNIDVPGSGTYMTATLIFDALGIKVQPVSHDQAFALQLLRNGDISALVFVAGKPARLFSDLKPEDGLRFLSVPSNPTLMQTYLPATLTSDDYGLISAPVDTLAVGAVMAVVTVPSESERYRTLARFTEEFFSNFGFFLEPSRHPKWREINLAAKVPGWTRFAPAEAWLKNNSQADQTQARMNLRKAFEAYLDEEASVSGHVILPEQKDAMFQQFLRLQENAMSGGRRIVTGGSGVRK
jgi:TRAP transporter TAXI family solute receptor